jgi:NADH-quinone oxidoreductase subunit A
MSHSLPSSLGIVAYLALFAVFGFLFVFTNLLVGRFLRPSDPHDEKLETYECGEPAIGSSFVQFDLRFYVVALVFIIFDVEVAFLFPWAVVFGKATNLADLVNTRSAAVVQTEQGQLQLTEAARGLYRELGVASEAMPLAEAQEAALAASRLAADVQQFVWLAVLAAMLFFVVLLIGFAYEWKTGALDWVRAVSAERSGSSSEPAGTVATPRETVVST